MLNKQFAVSSDNSNKCDKSDCNSQDSFSHNSIVVLCFTYWFLEQMSSWPILLLRLQVRCLLTDNGSCQTI